MSLLSDDTGGINSETNFQEHAIRERLHEASKQGLRGYGVQRPVRPTRDTGTPNEDYPWSLIRGAVWLLWRARWCIPVHVSKGTAED
jgi:hypothetical protein